MEKEIFERLYDNPKNEDGSDKPNKFLGIFEVIKRIQEDSYSEKFIGINKTDGKKYLVEGMEVSGFYNPGSGGVRYFITCLED